MKWVTNEYIRFKTPKAYPYWPPENQSINQRNKQTKPTQL